MQQRYEEVIGCLYIRMLCICMYSYVADGSFIYGTQSSVSNVGQFVYVGLISFEVKLNIEGAKTIWVIKTQKSIIASRQMLI